MSHACGTPVCDSVPMAPIAFAATGAPAIMVILEDVINVLLQAQAWVLRALDSQFWMPASLGRPMHRRSYRQQL